MATANLSPAQDITPQVDPAGGVPGFIPVKKFRGLAHGHEARQGALVAAVPTGAGSTVVPSQFGLRRFTRVIDINTFAGNALIADSNTGNDTATMTIVAGGLSATVTHTDGANPHTVFIEFEGEV